MKTASLDQRDQLPEVSVGTHPWNYAAIIQYADPPALPADNTSEPTKELEVDEALGKGIMIRNKKQMYKVASGKNWFTIFPRGLTITSFHEPLHWYHKTLTDKDGRIQITIGKLRNICWLDVSGKFQTVTLSQGIKYEIVLHVKSVDAEIVKFDAPVSFKITLPDGCKVDGERNFKELLKGGSWKDISLHEFMMTTENVGELQFCIYEHGGTWKSEIELGGISFKPKTTITPRPSNRQQQNVDAQQQQQNVDTQQQ
ncbi:uncharacterized protein PHLOEM PROTEIN 2-LIKE A4-like isoform X2 [Punica granatum]|uniref:Uncharacterized protein PHLOEM PROTEIN 2-LIKE A4-like isoform X2 n=1 Tax=Punica granatum TaxID=22663 RepID=A0A6P8DVS5_PUNGR|nr:uncharacterized protein PHLOEM PROTEIN 2-LIKE A4-like isoform X2 [Punica granatum]